MTRPWILLMAGSWLAHAQEPPRFDPKLNIAAQAAADKAAQAVKGAPFSAVAVRDTVKTLADGNRILNHEEQKMARDSQGRERMESIQSVDVLGERLPVANTVQILDPVAKVRYDLNPKKLFARKMDARGNAASLVQGGLALTAANTIPNKSTVKVEQLGSQTFEGVSAQGARTTTTIAAGQVGNERDLTIVDEVWYSPELHMDVMTKHNDPRSGEVTYRLTQLNRNEPDPSLFEVPKGYAVLEPAQPLRAIVTGPDGKTLTTMDLSVDFQK